MVQQTVEIATADGTCDASLHVPSGAGPWPAVIMYPDAGGLRDVFRDMGERMASLGYVTLVPNIYYRHGDFEPFDVATAFADPAQRDRLMGMVRSVTADLAASDAVAYIDFLTALPETTGNAVGTTGYCMGGRLSLITAGRLGERVGAAASFHGGGLASDTDPESPHLGASTMAATVYVAAAQDDGSFPQEQHDRLGNALREAGVDYTIETYPAGHGFAVPDNATYDKSAEERHWDALARLYGDALA